MAKISTSVAIDPKVLREAIEKAQYYGYRSTSDLVESLLRKWVDNPEKKV